MAVVQRVDTDRGDAVRIDLQELEPLALEYPAEPVERAFERQLTIKPIVCDCRSRMLRGGEIHALLHAADQAWSFHRPLHLTPDAIWITITRGVAEHINRHAEELRGRFVKHSGKQKIQVATNADIESAEGWRSVVADFEAAIADHIGTEAAGFFRASFSTSGPIERIVSQAILMEGMKQFFDYEICCVCGIPAVILEGTPADWREIHQRLQQLDGFGLVWWREMLEPLLAEFVRASEGNPDVGHWRRICRVMRDGSYGDPRFLEGWLPAFVLYIGDSIRSSELNPILKNPGARYPLGACGAQLAETPVRVRPPNDSCAKDVKLVAGLLGFSEDEHTGGLRPEAAFAVMEVPLTEQILSGLQERATFNQKLAANPEDPYLLWLPAILQALYAESNGLTLKLPDKPTLLRILPREHLQEVCSTSSIEGGPFEREAEYGRWLFFGWMGETRLWCTDSLDSSGKRKSPVIGVRSDGLSGRCPILAASPEQLLARLMALHEGEQIDALGEVNFTKAD